MNHENDMDHATAKDPVCGMDISPQSAFAQYEYGGRTYHFCSAHCLEKFRTEPASMRPGQKPSGPLAKDRS